MPATFYRTANGFIVTCNEEWSMSPDSLVLADTKNCPSHPELEAMLHRANMQPGLAAALAELSAKATQVNEAPDQDDAWLQYEAAQQKAYAVLAAAAPKGE